MSEQSVMAKIHALVEERVNNNVVTRVEWAVLGIIEKMGEIDGENAEFYRVCTHQQLHQMVKRAIGKYQPKAQTDPQLVMDGFQHLSKAYTMTREGELMLVPIGLCTDAELEARADELDRIGRGSINHAKEMRSYVRSRPAVAA